MECKWLFLVCLMSVGVLLAMIDAASPRDHGATTATVRCVLEEVHNRYSLTFSPDGKRLLSWTKQEGNDRIAEWDLETKLVRRRFDAEPGKLVSINYSQSGRYFALGYNMGLVSVRDAEGRALLSFKSASNFGARLKALSLSEKNGPFVYAVDACEVAQRRHVTTAETSVYSISWDGSHRITSAAATRYGTTFVCCSYKFLHVYHEGDFDSPKEITSFKVFKDFCITDVAISDDASLVMAYDYSGRDVALFDIKHDKLIKKWKAHDDGTVCAILPFHGRNWFATGNYSGEIKIWDEKGNLRALLKHKEFELPICALALTRDDGFLASSGEGLPIVIWDLRAFLKEASPLKK